MILKKTDDAKRAHLPRSSDYDKEFIKDWQKLSHSGRYDLKGLKYAMLLLIANNAPLSAEWKDHPLKGNWLGYRECHIGGDFLLIYKVDEHGSRRMACMRATISSVHSIGRIIAPPPYDLW